MSKRRPESHDFSESTDSWRSTRSRLFSDNASFNTPNDNDLHFDPSVSILVDLLKIINNYKKIQNDENELNGKAMSLLHEFPENSNIKMLKYTNQIIEISIFNKQHLYHNTNFPFLREPMSISVQSDVFANNIASYRCFKKIILKNIKIEPILSTLELYNDRLGQITFQMKCFIRCNNGGLVLESLIDNKILESANIIFNMPNIWYISYMLISNDSNLNNNDKINLIQEIWKNLSLCFQEMNDIEVAVTVDNENVIKIANILHCYYTN
jgi:hypothetical protein